MPAHESLLDEWMSSYWHDIWGYIYVMTGKPETADDLTQDTFVNAYRSLSAFRGDASARTWLLAIARNRIRNYKRSAAVRKLLLMHNPDNRTSASAEEDYMRREHRNEIWSQLMKLPVKLREVLLLEARYGYSKQQMAAMLGIPEGTVKSRLSRAR